MSELTLSGRVESGVWDDDAGSFGTVLIGGQDIMRAVEETFERVYPRRVVTVAIADERFEGDLCADHGSQGYSEYTPADPAELTVGPHNLLDVLARFDGQEVTVWIADEPADLSRRNAEISAKRAAEFAQQTAAYGQDAGRFRHQIELNLQQIERLTAANEGHRKSIEELEDVIRRREAGEDARPKAEKPKPQHPRVADDWQQWRV